MKFSSRLFKFLFLIILLGVAARCASAVSIEQYCTSNLAGPVSAISCTLNNAEPNRAFWITLHFVGSGLTHSVPTYPGCLTIGTPAGPQSLTATGNDDWFYQMLAYSSGAACCTGAQSFVYNFDNPVTNVQFFVAQIQGIRPLTSGNFSSFPIFGTGGTPSGSLDAVAAGEFIGAWVSTSRGPFTTFGAGPGYTLLAAVGPDTWEWQIAGGAGTYTVDFTGTTTAYWNVKVASFTTAANRPDVCGIVPALHRRTEY